MSMENAKFKVGDYVWIKKGVTDRHNNCLGQIERVDNYTYLVRHVAPVGASFSSYLEGNLEEATLGQQFYSGAADLVYRSEKAGGG